VSELPVSPRHRQDLTDAIQEVCIARAKEKDLTSYAIAKATDGQVSEDHVHKFLTRRSSMGTHKVQHILRVLGLAIKPGKM
jgi:hypothetical protein